jgi:hypothetical protein
MNRDKLISGQLVLRDSSLEKPADGSNRKLMMVIGVIAVPNHLNLKGEHKYTIAGRAEEDGIMGLYKMVDPDFQMPGDIAPGFQKIELKLFPETEEDISDETRGQGLGGIVTSHHRWRV